MDLRQLRRHPATEIWRPEASLSCEPCRKAHRYRADTSAKSIEELKPVLGLELTATPQVESASKSTRFKNVIYDYPLAKAMQEGYE